MARREDDGGRAAQADAQQECMPCGGRGTLISKLGGTESVVRCPWCEGSGRRRKGVDAQAHWLARRGAAAGADEAAAQGSGDAADTAGGTPAAGTDSA